MIANYHTHTYRCGHAEGDVREYAEEALKAGLQILGFSDHTPYDFFDTEPRNRPIRMKPEELPEYAASVRKLAEELAGRCRVLLGVEAEYYPRYFPRLLALLRANGVRYMILGQHFLENEIDGYRCQLPTADPALLARYVDQTAEALETGLFTYFAHPDVFHFVGDEAVYEEQMRRLCRTALKTGTPLEINLLGVREKRHYPNERFWRIAAREGNQVILGCDAHRPEDIGNREAEEQALGMVRRLGLRLLETVPIREV